MNKKGLSEVDRQMLLSVIALDGTASDDEDLVEYLDTGIGPVAPSEQDDLRPISEDEASSSDESEEDEDEDYEDSSSNSKRSRSRSKKGKGKAAAKKSKPKNKSKAKVTKKKLVKEMNAGELLTYRTEKAAKKDEKDLKRFDRPAKFASTTPPDFTGGEDKKKLKPSAKYTVTADSPPIDHFNMFIPPSVRDQQAEYSNSYLLNYRAQGGTHYNGEGKSRYNLTRFTYTDVNHLYATYMINGLSPRPSLGAHFDDDWACGRSRIRDLWAEESHLKAARSFFHIAPPVNRPRRGPHNPAWKVDTTDVMQKCREFVEGVCKMSVMMVVIGLVIALDEITIGFQGRKSKLKLRIRHKNEGDGFQVCGGHYSYHATTQSITIFAHWYFAVVL